MQSIQISHYAIYTDASNLGLGFASHDADGLRYMNDMSHISACTRWKFGNVIAEAEAYAVLSAIIAAKDKGLNGILLTIYCDNTATIWPSALGGHNETKR